MNHLRYAWILAITTAVLSQLAQALVLPPWAPRPLLRATLSEFDAEGREIRRGISKDLTQFRVPGQSLPTAFAHFEEYPKDCDALVCSEPPKIVYFQVTQVAETECGSTRYVAIERTLSHPAPRRLEILDHTTRICEDVLIRDLWQVRLISQDGLRDIRYYGGNPTPVLSIQ